MNFWTLNWYMPISQLLGSLPGTSRKRTLFLTKPKAAVFNVTIRIAKWFIGIFLSLKLNLFCIKWPTAGNVDIHTEKNNFCHLVSLVFAGMRNDLCSRCFCSIGEQQVTHLGSSKDIIWIDDITYMKNLNCPHNLLKYFRLLCLVTVPKNISVKRLFHIGLHVILYNSARAAHHQTWVTFRQRPSILNMHTPLWTSKPHRVEELSVGGNLLTVWMTPAAGHRQPS